MYHRVLASDGSVSTSSESVKVQIRREGNECAAPESIPGFVTLGDFGDSRYYLSNDVSEPINAQLTAESFGGFLATIGSQGENDFIQQHVPELTYIGLNDVDDEGNLVWFNGEPITFNNIDPCDICEPNADNQDFVVIAPWNGSWSFSNIFNQRRFVMEIPCSTSSTANSSAVARAKMEEVLTKSEDLMMDKLMPNPARDYINAVILSKMEQDVELRIYDSRGTLIRTKNASLIEGANSVELNINDLAAGFYYIQIPQKSGKPANLRFVKVSE